MRTAPTIRPRAKVDLVSCAAIGLLGIGLLHAAALFAYVATQLAAEIF